MEIRINKEIKEYKEGLFFGLSVRQLFCSVLAVGVAVGTYFGLSGIAGKEMLSWLCIVLAAPFGAAGFFSYNGMTFEKFLWAYIQSEFIRSGRRLYRSENYLYNILRESEKENAKAKGKAKDTQNRTAVNTH